jgi:hypothetical protein
MVHTINYFNFPNWLRHSQLFDKIYSGVKSVEYLHDSFEVKYYKETDKINNLNDLELVLNTARFFLLYSLPESVYWYAYNNKKSVLSYLKTTNFDDSLYEDIRDNTKFLDNRYKYKMVRYLNKLNIDTSILELSVDYTFSFCILSKYLIIYISGIEIAAFHIHNEHGLYHAILNNETYEDEYSLSIFTYQNNILSLRITNNNYEYDYTLDECEIKIHLTEFNKDRLLNKLSSNREVI